MRLIDADALKRIAQEYGFTFVDFQALDNAPTIDAVPVVRCKDCKHNMTEVHSTEYGRFIACEIFSKRHSFDDFCSYGERKDGEG